MKVSFYITKRIEAEADDKYKILFDETEMSNCEWEDIYQELCEDLAKQFDVDEDDYITDMIIEEE